MRVVVIVEDDGDVAEYQAAALEGYAYVTIVSHDFSKCLDPATWMGVEVAVVDLMLPDIQGEDICRYLLKQFPAIRRIICTAKPLYMIPDLRELAHVVLQKPFDVNVFVQAVVGDE